MKIVSIYIVLITFFVNEIFGQVGLSMKGLSLFNLTLYLLFTVWVYELIKERKMFQPNNLNKYLILMIYYVLISIVIKFLRDEIPRLSVVGEILAFKQFLHPILLFFLLFNIIEDKRACNHALFGLYFLLVVSILLQLSATFGITNFAAASIAKHGRAGGFGAAGVFAVLLVLFFPFALSGSFLMKKSALFKAGCLVLFFLMLMGLVNSGSRNGALSLFVSLVFYLLILKREKIMGMLPIMLMFIGVIAVGGIAFVASPPSLKEKIIERFDPSKSEDMQDYSSSRFGIWKSGLEFFVEKPILGHGQNSFLALSRLKKFSKIHTPHNDYLECLVEFGIVGLVIFLLIFYKIFQNMWQTMNITTSPWEKQLYISYISGFCGYATGIFFTNVGPARNLFWIYTAIMYKYAQLDMDLKRDKPNPDMPGLTIEN